MAVMTQRTNANFYYAHGFSLVLMLSVNTQCRFDLDNRVHVRADAAFTTRTTTRKDDWSSGEMGNGEKKIKR